MLQFWKGVTARKNKCVYIMSKINSMQFLAFIYEC